VRKTKSRRLVLDASLMRAVGVSDAVDAGSQRCHEFLVKVRAIYHRVFLSSAIETEWMKHRSNVASDWIVSMTGIRKMDFFEISADAGLRLRIQEAATKTTWPIMLKDIHLIEAALSSDRRIISLDENAKRHFATASAKIEELRDIIWVNPKDAKADPVGWLERGAPAEKRFKLGSLSL
jgi:hypothetical protein